MGETWGHHPDPSLDARDDRRFSHCSEDPVVKISSHFLKVSVESLDIYFSAIRSLNIPGVYAQMDPRNAEAATLSGDASQSLPGPDRPL